MVCEHPTQNLPCTECIRAVGQLGASDDGGALPHASPGGHRSGGHPTRLQEFTGSSTGGGPPQGLRGAGVVTSIRGYKRLDLPRFTSIYLCRLKIVVDLPEGRIDTEGFEEYRLVAYLKVSA